MATEKMVWELVIELDKSSIQRVQAWLDVFARDTGKKLDGVRLDKLSKDFADLQIAKQRLDAEFRKNQKLYSSGLIDTNKLRQSKEALNAISSATTEAQRKLQNYKNRGDENLSRLQAKFNDVGSAWMFMKNTIIGIGSAIASYLSVSKLVELSNTFTSMENKVKQIAEWDAIPALQKRIFEMAQSSRAPVDELTSAFVRFDLINKQLGGSQEETAIMLDTLSKGLALSWATAAETWSVMLQLSQAFGSGKLAGDEFRAIAEAMPSLLDILAKQLWVNRGALKDMASEGLITSEVLKTALLEANEQVNASFKKSSVTIGQAMTMAMNKFIMKFGELDKQYGITEKIVNGIWNVTNAIFISIEAIMKYSWIISEATKWVVAFIGAKALYWLYTILPWITARMVLLGATTVTTTWFVSALRLAYMWLLATFWPVWLAIAWLTALIYAGAKGYEYLTKKQEESQTINYKLARAIQENEKAQENLQKQMDKWNITNKEYFNELRKLEAEHNTLTAWIEATKNEAWNYEEAINALASTKYEPNTDWYVREREEIIKNINETIKLLEARKALWIVDLDKKTAEYKERQAKVSQTNTFTGAGGTSELSWIGSQITAQLQEQSSISKEIAKEKDKILNIDKAIADIRSGAKYQWTSWNITQTGGWTGGGSWAKKGIDAEKEALKKLEEEKKQQAEAEERRNKWRIEQVNDLKEEQKAYIDEFVKWAEEAQKEQEKLTNEIEKTSEAIAKLEEALAELESERVTTLGDRAVQIAEERKKLEAEIIKLKNEGITGTSLDLETLRKFWSGTVDGGDVEKLIQLKEAQAEINKLLEEEVLIKSNATEDELKEWVRQAELSPTARFLEEFEKKKQALEEDKILKQEELASYQTQLTEQTNAYNNFVQAKTLLEEQYSEKIKTIEASITQSITYENQKRIESLKAVERQAIATANALRRAGSGGSTSSSSSTTNNTINNSPNVVVNANVGSSVDIQSLGNELANSVSLGSKGIY